MSASRLLQNNLQIVPAQLVGVLGGGGVLDHVADELGGDDDVFGLDLGPAGAGHALHHLAQVRAGVGRPVQLRVLVPAAQAAAVVPQAEQRRDAQGHGDDGRQRHPQGDAGGEAVEIVPAAVLLADEHHHHKVHRRIEQHRDQGQEHLLRPDQMAADEAAEGHDGQDGADPVQEEPGAGEDEHEALDRGQDAQGHQKGQRHRRDRRVHGDHHPVRQVVVARAQAVHGVGDAQQHGKARQDVGVDREHAEGADAHVVEVLVVDRHQIHDHAHADAHRHDARADEREQALHPVAADRRVLHRAASFRRFFHYSMAPRPCPENRRPHARERRIIL